MEGVAAGLLFFMALMFGLWVWSLIHCITNKRLSDSNRTIGIIMIVFLGLLGSLVYLFLPRDGKKNGTSRISHHDDDERSGGVGRGGNNNGGRSGGRRGGTRPRTSAHRR
jgi:hypothetical protein